MKPYKTFIMPFGILMALASTSGAMAQTVDPAAQVAPADDTTEVIVTAERRTSTAQKSALAITAVSGEELTRQSKKELDEIILATPAVRMQLTGGGVGVYIRGVGTNDTGFGDPSINFNIDGVYQQDPGMVTMGTFDINRVEVLRGPQGTLYGRNATAGSLNLISNNPDLRDIYGSLSVDAGNYSSLRTEGMVNVPISDKIAIRASGFTNQHDGYVTPNNTDDADQFGLRLKLLADLTPNATLVLTAQHVEEKGNGPGLISTTAGAPLSSMSDPWTSTGSAGVQDHQFSLAAAQLDIGLNGAKLTTIASYTRAHRHDITKNGAPVDQNEVTEQKALEVRLASDSDSALSWVVGAMYLKGDYSRFNPNLNGSGFTLAQTLPLKSYGLFGQAKYDFSSSLHLTAGLRYSSDEKSQTNLYSRISDGEARSAPLAQKQWASTDYKLNLQKDLSPRNMLYATISTGYKAGGFQTISGINSTTLQTFPSTSYNPEKLKAYEIGSKNRFLNNRLTLNISGYYYDYQNYQVKFPVFAGPYLTVHVENAGSATIKGVEIEGSYKITDADSIDGFVTFSSSKFGIFRYTTITPGGATLVIHDGEATPNAPDLTARLAYQHRFELGESKSLTARIESTYSDGYWATHERTFDSFQPSYTKSNASLRFADDNRGYSLRAYVKNIEDVAVRSAGGQNGLNLQPPRTYGVAVDKLF